MIFGISRDDDGWIYALPDWCIVEGPPVDGWRTYKVRPVARRVLRHVMRVHCWFLCRRGWVKDLNGFARLVRSS